MGSDSDLPTMRAAAEALRDFGIACEVRVPRCRQAPANGRSSAILVACQHPQGCA